MWVKVYNANLGLYSREPEVVKLFRAWNLNSSSNSVKAHPHDAAINEKIWVSIFLSPRINL